MIIFEIENHDKGGSNACVKADTIEHMHKTLIKKGFECMVKYDLYCLINEDGNEVSAMPAVFNPVDRLKDFKKKQGV